MDFKDFSSTAFEAFPLTDLLDVIVSGSTLSLVNYASRGITHTIPVVF